MRQPRPMGRLRRFVRAQGAFTGAEKALLICMGLAVVLLVGNLVRGGSDQAAKDSQQALRDNPLSGGGRSVGDVGAPMGVVPPQDPGIKAADAALRDRFEIVAPDFKGTRAGNQLTQAEYDRVLKQYADIAAGRTDIKFNASDSRDPEFKKGVMKDFGTLMQTPSGRALLDSLANNPNGNTLTVKVNRDSAGNPDLSNAYADASDPSKRSQWGNGRGVPSTISYVPGKGVDVPGGTSKWLPLRGDVVLYHELAHAMHITHGTMDDSIVTLKQGASSMDVQSRIRNSEYQAVGLGQYKNNSISENVYRAERNGIKGKKGALPTDGALNRRTEYVVQVASSPPPP